MWITENGKFCKHVFYIDLIDTQIQKKNFTLKLPSFLQNFSIKYVKLNFTLGLLLANLTVWYFNSVVFYLRLFGQKF